MSAWWRYDVLRTPPLATLERGAARIFLGKRCALENGWRALSRVPSSRKIQCTGRGHPCPAACWQCGSIHTSSPTHRGTTSPILSPRRMSPATADVSTHSNIVGVVTITDRACMAVRVNHIIKLSWHAHACIYVTVSTVRTHRSILESVFVAGSGFIMLF
jgi:hypothetical protein